MVRGLEHLSCEKKLREVSLLSLGMRWLWGHLPAAPSTYKEVVKKTEPAAWWEGERQ